MPNPLHPTITTILITLLLPMLLTLPGPLTHYTKVTRTVKTASLLSLIPLMTFMNQGTEFTTTTLTWLPTQLNLKIGLLLDLYSMTFLPTALFVTWAILEFTHWYMTSEPNLSKFANYLLLFLLAMLTLITANNLLQLFIGWEGVGIMSFLLISWWHARPMANTAALQAIIYNRIGDIGMILVLAWTATSLNTWDLLQLTSHPTTPLLPLLGLILAAMGKSAQFGLHPWLPSAMEGPTPVSALLHSSTMVVAGVFLLIRLHPLLAPNPYALTTCLCLGAMTTTFAALCAITQNDIKKIIAFSTSSQLGLMMLTLGLNQPELAFLHITTHAFFKAMLFLCSGSIIHNLANEQDIRKMGGLQQTLPITSTCLTLGSLALAGTPFLAGFFTKDTIIETMNTSNLNAWALTTTLLATALTAAYSLRLTYYTQLGHPRYPSPLLLTEQEQNQTTPIIRLAIGSITMGLLVCSTLPPMKPLVMTMTAATKLAAVIVTLLGALCALDLAMKTAILCDPAPNLSHTALSQLAFYNTQTHRQTPQSALKTASFALQLSDRMWYETLGPMLLKTLNISLINKLTTYHMGSIKTHLATFTITLISYFLLTNIMVHA